jgi:hypothetical protein
MRYVFSHTAVRTPRRITWPSSSSTWPEPAPVDLPELDVRVADAPGDVGAVPARDGERVVVHVDADDATGGSDDLAREEGDLAAPRPQVEHRLARSHVALG